MTVQELISVIIFQHPEYNQKQVEKEVWDLVNQGYNCDYILKCFHTSLNA